METVCAVAAAAGPARTVNVSPAENRMCHVSPGAMGKVPAR
jgi:hypothetical protein